MHNTYMHKLYDADMDNLLVLSNGHQNEMIYCLCI